MVNIYEMSQGDLGIEAWEGEGGAIYEIEIERVMARLGVVEGTAAILTDAGESADGHGAHPPRGESAP